MNMQLCIPYVPCPFHCPMCIASDPKRYDNLYGKNRMEYIGKLGTALRTRKFVDVVLTGDTDPTLDKTWLKDVTEMLGHFYYRPGIEIQTHNYGWRGMDGIDVNAFSITTPHDFERIESIHTDYGINRLVVLGTVELLQKFLLDKVDLSAFRQITIKALQHTASKVGSVDEYIDAVKGEEILIKSVAARLSALGFKVKVDMNCQEAEGRYAIFREDGKLYKAWDE